METLQNLSQEECMVVKLLQGDFPLVNEPYKLLAEQAGMSEEKFLECVQSLSENKKIRKMGAVLKHRQVGFKTNVLCVWEVADEILDEVGAKMAGHKAVSHCYDRNKAEGWNYNFYTMIHAHTKEECENIVSELAKDCGLNNYKMLYTVKEWKKNSMKYFS